MARYVSIVRSELQEYGSKNSDNHKKWIEKDYVEAAEMDDRTFIRMAKKAKVKKLDFKRKSCASQARKLYKTLGFSK